MLKLNAKNKTAVQQQGNSNTTLVKVKLRGKEKDAFGLDHSNTTLVKVKFVLTLSPTFRLPYSNTTLVKVKYEDIRENKFLTFIQIQLLLKLNLC